ncbi:MAG: hypothetical protein RLZZ618_2456 [Pseudomonadota bacterium]|jgi:hypothetical protein
MVRGTMLPEDAEATRLDHRCITRHQENPMPVNTLARLQEKTRAFAKILRSWGYDDTDFVVESDTTSELGSLFGIAGGVLVVKRRSTGESRVYQAAVESQWFDSVLHDLANGHLADPLDAEVHARGPQGYLNAAPNVHFEGFRGK